MDQVDQSSGVGAVMTEGACDESAGSGEEACGGAKVVGQRVHVGGVESGA